MPKLSAMISTICHECSAMRVTNIAAVCLWLAGSELLAENSPSNCFDADSDRLFSTAEVLPVGTNLGTMVPQVEYDANGTPIGLNWMPCANDVSVEVEQVGAYHGKAIYRLIYRKSRGAPDTPKSQLVCAVFGYQDDSSNGMRIRPFFVMADDQLRWLEAFFTSKEDQPFALEIHKTIKGNGVYWTSYTFVFTPREARILARSEGGRGMHTKTHRYDATGKIASTYTSTEE
jgi:hypothetical protein